MDFKNKVVIVTGASSGIGLAIARLFSIRGARIVLAARSEDKLKSISKELPNSLSIPTDITKIDEVKKLIEKTIASFNRIDILVNNAGRGYDSSLENIKIETFQKIIDLDLIAPIQAMQLVIPIMRSQGSGEIINISSGTALMVLPEMGAYAGIKAALAKVSLTANEELKSDGIHVRVVYPYITATDFEKNTLKEKSREESIDNSNSLPQPDSAEYIAERILLGLDKNQTEIFAHDWMNKTK